MTTQNQLSSEIKFLHTALMPFLILLAILFATPVYAVRLIATVPVGAAPQAVAVNSITNKTYVVNSVSGTVTVIDGVTNNTTEVGVGTTPKAIAVNSVTNRIYVSNSGSDSVTVIDGEDDIVIATVEVGDAPQGIAVNPITNKIYVTNYISASPSNDYNPNVPASTVTVIDGATNTTTTIERMGKHPWKVAINPITNKIYVANWYPTTNYVRAIDGSSNSVTLINVGPYQRNVAVNTATNKIYVAMNSTTGVRVIDGTNNEVFVFPSISGATDFAFNKATNKIYVSYYEGVVMIDGATNATTEITEHGIQSSAIAFNPNTNHIYAVTPASDDVTIVDGTNNSFTSIGVGDNPFDIAVNTVTNRIYVTNQDDNTVSVLEDNLPPIANAGNDQNILQGEVAYLDGSLSSDPEDATITYAWTLDSAPSGSTAALVGADTVSPSLTPKVVGAYRVSLVVNDGALDSAASTVIIDVDDSLPPNAVALGNGSAMVSGDVPLMVTFESTGSFDPEGGALTYNWDFGDGNTSTESYLDYTYLDAGIYTAVLTVTDEFGKKDQAIVDVTVMASNMAPVILPKATPNNGEAPLDVQFAANATDVNPDDVLEYEWNFGDGSSNNFTANPLHTYLNQGTHIATVSVSDGVNDAVKASLTISVSSELTIQVTEAKVQHGKKGKVRGKISMKANFTYEGMPLPTDTISVVFDGVNLVEVPFSSFREKSASKFKYEAKHRKVEIDFARGKIKASGNKMLTKDVDNTNGIDVEVSFGSATGTDHVDMTRDKGHGKHDSHGDRDDHDSHGDRDDHDSDLSHKRD